MPVAIFGHGINGAHWLANVQNADIAQEMMDSGEFDHLTDVEFLVAVPCVAFRDLDESRGTPDPD